MLDNLCASTRIVKTRYIVHYEGFDWELDIFEENNAGLIMAEIELENKDDRPGLPIWITSEVTADPKYLNQNLTLHPYCEWHTD